MPALAVANTLKPRVEAVVTNAWAQPFVAAIKACLDGIYNHPSCFIRTIKLEKTTERREK